MHCLGRSIRNYLLPVTNFLTWDDEVHYGNANSVSYLTNAEITNSDRMIVEQFYRGTALV